MIRSGIRNVSRFIVAAGAWLALSMPAAPTLRAQTSASIPPQLREVEIEQRLGETIPLDARFRDESGQTVSLGDYFKEKPVILSFAYYECPMLCTMILNGLLKAVRTLSLDAGRDFEIVNVSIKPSETPELAGQKKERYVNAYDRTGGSEGWHFLTGDEEAIGRVTGAAGYRFYLDPSTGEYAHASGILVLTPEGRIARYFYGIEYSARDLRLGLVEASLGEIGTPVDKVLLYCFHYDPATGKYGLVIMNVLRLVGSLTVLLLAGYILLMVRRDRRKALPVEGGHGLGSSP